MKALSLKVISTRVASETAQLKLAIEQGNDLLGCGNNKVKMPHFLSVIVDELKTTLGRTQQLVDNKVRVIKVNTKYGHFM